jgi:prepilin-type N-terminal cleavage/methylation domain-containing protein
MTSQAIANQATCDQSEHDKSFIRNAAVIASRPVQLFGRPARSGFTVIEILTVVVIIGILIGLLVPGLMMAVKRSREFAIENDISQLEAAIEAFKTKYGFYPPDFSAIRATSGATPTDMEIANMSNLLLPYINRIAPNHGELTLAGTSWPAGYRRIDVWMKEVGQHLRPDSALVFWLSGLIKNKQYPLTYVGTGDVVHGQLAYNAGADGTVEREIFFDFKGSKLVLDATTTPVANAVARYSQLDNAPEYYVYFETKNLLATSTLPSCVVNGVTVKPYANSSNVLYRKDSYQILAPGLDAVFAETASTSPSVGSVTPRERDNLSNFSEGRLERLLLQ